MEKKYAGDKNHNWRGGQVENKCVICGKEFPVFPSGKHRVVCSKECNDKQKSKKVEIICKVCGKKRKVKELEIKRGNGKFCSQKCHYIWNSENKKGENSPGWKGGITPINKKIRCSIEYRLWRESVFARDNWTCQECNKKGGELNAHHIKPFAKYPELRFAIDNGITFCITCHNKTKGRVK